MKFKRNNLGRVRVGGPKTTPATGLPGRKGVSYPNREERIRRYMQQHPRSTRRMAEFAVDARGSRK